MKLFWEDNVADAEIGRYVLRFTTDTNDVLETICLYDYTCEYRKQRIYGNRMVNVRFIMEYCNVYSESFEIEDVNVTLDDAKKMAEDWLIDMYINRYETTRKTNENLYVYTKWLSEYKSNRDNTDTKLNKEVYTAYAEETDMTFIMEDYYKDNQLISTECVGFYFGKPNKTSTSRFKNKLKANF